MNIRAGILFLALLAGSFFSPSSASAQWGYYPDVWTSWYAPDWTGSWNTSYYAPTYSGWSSSYYAPSYSGWNSSYYGSGGCSSCGSCSNCGGCNSCGAGYGVVNYGGCNSCGCNSCGCSPGGYSCYNNGCSNCGSGGCNSCGGNCGVACASGNCGSGSCGTGGCGTAACAPDNTTNWKGKLEPTPDSRSRSSADPEPYAPSGTRDREPGPMRTFEEPAADPRRNTPDPNDSRFERTRDRTSPPPAGNTTDPGDKGLFDSESRRPVTEELEPVKQKKPDSTNADDSRIYEKPVPAGTNGAGTAAPGPMLNLDSKITWRSVPERTRIQVRSGLSVPVVARRNIEATPALDNSGWETVGGETRIVRK